MTTVYQTPNTRIDVLQGSRATHIFIVSNEDPQQALAHEGLKTAMGLPQESETLPAMTECYTKEGRRPSILAIVFQPEKIATWSETLADRTDLVRVIHLENPQFLEATQNLLVSLSEGRPLDVASLPEEGREIIVKAVHAWAEEMQKRLRRVFGEQTPPGYGKMP